MDELVGRLYTVPPEEFIAARDEAVREVRGRDPAQAAKIAKLRRPTLAAWLVNLLAIKRPDLLAELGELSDSLREAQRELKGQELRQLSGQRRAAISALVREARRLAVETNPALRRRAGSLPLGDVEQTLEAALADAEAAELVRSGQLVKSIEYAGFGEVPRPQLRVISGGVGEAAKAGAGARAEPTPARERRAAQRELTAARTAESRAGAELERATEAERDAAHEREELDAALADLQRRRAEAEEELSRRRLARKTAERAASAARRRVGEAEAAVAAVATALGRGAAPDEPSQSGRRPQARPKKRSGTG